MLALSSFKIAKPMGKTSIIIRHPPLDAVYMVKNKITQGFCCEYTEKKSGGKIHNGIDISVPAGEPVFSIVEGMVVHNHKTWGEDNYKDSFLIIEHDCIGEKFYVYYGHIHSIIKEWGKVKAGERIGTIKRDKSGEYGDHLHLSFSFGKDWDHHGWGYNFSCGEAKSEGYVNPLKYLIFTGESPPGRMVSCEPVPTPEPTPTPSPIPIRPRNMKFDVKTKFMEKESLAAAKAGFISYIQQSSWAKTVEFGEDNSLWLTNYKRSRKGNKILIEMDLEVRSPAMFREGNLIKRENLNFEFDASQVKDIQSFRDPRLYEVIKKQLTGQNIPITKKAVFQGMGFIFAQGCRRNPSPKEVLEGLIVGAYLMKALEEQFTTYKG
jgi:hypothetical protein